MKVQIFTDHLYILTIFSQHVDSNYKWSIKISTFIATIYLKGLLIRKGLVTHLGMSLYTLNLAIFMNGTIVQTLNLAFKIVALGWVNEREKLDFHRPNQI